MLWNNNSQRRSQTEKKAASGLTGVRQSIERQKGALLRKAIALVFLIALSLVSVSSVFGREMQSVAPQPRGKIEVSGSPGPFVPSTATGANALICYTQAFAGTPAYYWPIPEYQTTSYAMRFTTCKNETELLKSVSFYVYDPGDGTYGNDTITVSIHLDDGLGMPGSVLQSHAFPPGSYNYYPAITACDLTGFSIYCAGDFYVSINTNSQTPDYESIVSDDGTIGTGRSYYYQGAWQRFADGVGGYDFNFHISVELCHDCPKSPSSNFPQPQITRATLAPELGAVLPNFVPWRKLTVKQVRFRRDGDCLFNGKGEIFGFGAVSSMMDPPQAADFTQCFLLSQSSTQAYTIERSKRSKGKHKCEDPTCGDRDDDCRWEIIDRVVYYEDPYWYHDPVDVRLLFWETGKGVDDNDLDTLARAIDYGKDCIAAYYRNSLQPATDCAAKWAYAENAFNTLCNDVPLSPGGKPVGGWEYEFSDWQTSSTGGCFRQQLGGTVGGSIAKVDLLWEDGIKKQTGGNQCQKQAPSDATIDFLKSYVFIQPNGAEERFVAQVGFVDPDDNNLTASLRDPNAYLPTNPNPWTREFGFAIDDDANPNTGCPTWPFCGAGYYVSIRQRSSGGAIAVADTIYKWDRDCCHPEVPAWIPLPDRPYERRIQNLQVEIKAPLSAFGDPQVWSSWAVLIKDDQVISTCPEQPCGTRLTAVREADAECPVVASGGLTFEEDTIVIVFSEPMAPIQLTDVTIVPAVSISLNPDATKKTLKICGISEFDPGIYTVKIYGTAEDLAGNALDGDKDGVCGGAFVHDFCIPDDRFRATDQSGTPKRVFGAQEVIYASGEGFVPGSQVYLYLVLPEDTERNGIRLDDLSANGRDIVTATGGILTGASVGTAVAENEYCIVADDGDGVLEYSDWVAGMCGPEIMVGDPCQEGIYDDIIAWWPLDGASGSAGDVDVAEGNHLTRFGSPTAISGMVNGCLHFDGVDDYDEVPDNADLLDFGPSLGDEVGDFSFEAWIRTSKATGRQIICDKSSGNLGYTFFIDNGKLAVKMADGTAAVWTSTGSSVANGAWRHVGFSVDRDATDGLRFYVDGSLTDVFDPTARSGSLDNAGPFRLGTYSSSVSDLFGSGEIDEPTLSERALTPAEFHFIWNNGSLGKCTTDSLSTCHATGDIDGDLLPLAVSDLTYLRAFIYQDGPAPPLIWEADLNGDCVVDTVDVNMLRCYFLYGLGCIPGYPVQTCCDPIVQALPYTPGDANGDQSIDISDAVYLIAYIFAGGPAPDPLLAGDASCEGEVDISDAVYLIAYIFAGGPAPCEGSLGKLSPEESMFLPRNLSPYSATIKLSESDVVEGNVMSMVVGMQSDGDVAGVQLEFKADAVRADEIVVQTAERSANLQVFSGVVDGLFKVGLIDMTGRNAIAAGDGPIVTFDFKGDKKELDLVNAIICDRQAQKLSVRIERSEKTTALPKQFSLSQNYPNPFNPSTAICFALPKSGEVCVEVHNVLGQKVKTLASGFQLAGVHRVVWDGTDDGGNAVASGVYFYRIVSNEFSASKKMILLK